MFSKSARSRSTCLPVNNAYVLTDYYLACVFTRKYNLYLNLSMNSREDSHSLFLERKSHLGIPHVLWSSSWFRWDSTITASMQSWVRLGPLRYTFQLTYAVKQRDFFTAALHNGCLCLALEFIENSSVSMKLEQCRRLGCKQLNHDLHWGLQRGAPHVGRSDVSDDNTFPLHTTISFNGYA
jgi:hypothetical protein